MLDEMLLDWKQEGMCCWLGGGVVKCTERIEKSVFLQGRRVFFFSEIWVGRIEVYIRKW